MFIAALMIVSSIVLSSAQPEAQPSSGCMTAYNATFSSDDPTCATAYYLLLTGNATDEQRMMVCNEGQQCNYMLENVITECGNMVSLVIELHTRYTALLFCIGHYLVAICFSFPGW